jgi:hypothetical protein
MIIRMVDIANIYTFYEVEKMTINEVRKEFNTTRASLDRIVDRKDINITDFFNSKPELHNEYFLNEVSPLNFIISAKIS